mmetsp:Transcript_62123/g.110704  ORF Transcript_62123/g.110704 Transcript_62123/m.110704 type:complete len:85 (-) Transcript_62123:705-959(-)
MTHTSSTADQNNDEAACQTRANKMQLPYWSLELLHYLTDCSALARTSTKKCAYGGLVRAHQNAQSKHLGPATHTQLLTALEEKS